VGVLLLPLWLIAATPSGDLFGRWSDHLRHQGESVALFSKGPKIYGMTYGAAVEGLILPCDEHLGLWPKTGIPYPPLAVALHYPFALAEQVIRPSLVHATLTWFFGLVGLLTVVWVTVQLAGWRRWVFLLAFGPLIVGTGLSGFYDTVWLAFATRAVILASPSDAAISFVTHFRGAVTLGLLAHAKSRFSRLILAVLVIPNLCLLAFVSRHLGEFETNSRLHWSRPVAWWFPITTLAVVWLTRREKRLWALIVPCAVLFFLDRQSAFWHLLILVPPATDALRSASAQNALLVIGWATITAQAFLDSYIPFPIFWLMLR
jgi:hypothetical protein